MEIFCLACTYIVQTYNYSRVKKVHEHIPHMQSSWGLLFMDYSSNLHRYVKNWDALSWNKKRIKKLTMQKPLLMDCTYAIGKS